jgi:M6 family metalloprotease-like protein
MGRRLLTLLLSIAALCQPSYGAPVYGRLMTLGQPDGQRVEVRVWGDEFYQIVESVDGYTLIRDPANRIICYAQLSSDKTRLASTGAAVGSRDPGSMGLGKHLRVSTESVLGQVATARLALASADPVGAMKTAGTGWINPATTVNGAVQGLCLLIDFSDEVGTIQPSAVADFCNQVGYAANGNSGSVRDYYYEVSAGHLVYTNFVAQQYYRAVQTKAYYDDPAIEYGVRARELIIEALTALDTSGFDFSQYDADHDGKVDAVNCFYAGPPDNGWSQGLWPHSGYLSFTADGVSVSRYQISDMGSELYLDTFCHENGHLLCNWPDLYDYDFDSSGVGKYCLMSDMASRTNPVQPCAYLKYIAGWADTTLLVNHQIGLPLNAGLNRMYKLENPTNANEYFLIENRQRTGRDAALPDDGLALWHIDTEGSNNWQQRTASLHYEVSLVQADGRWDLESNRNTGDTTDLWKSPTYTTCGSMTNPSTNWWDGTTSILGISQVSVSSPTMTFAFGVAAIQVNPASLLHTVYPGSSLPSDTITVTNTSPIVHMNYAVECNDFWLSASPATGDSQGETDAITITYDNNLIPHWPRGTYGTTITVRAPEAHNSPQTIMVVLLIGSVGPDFDGDTDVDQADFGHLQSCLSGQAVKQTRPECLDADLDHDEDVDKTDLSILKGCFAGPGVSAELDCDGFTP